MRKAVLAALVLFTAATLFGDSVSCTQPNLVVTGIQGEMQAPCAGAIDFTTASFSAPSTTGGSATGSGAGAGTSVSGTLRVTKVFDKSSQALMLACAQGKHLQSVTLSYPSAQNAVKVVFGDVIISSVNESVNPTNESVEFKYAKIMLQSGGTTVTGSVMGGARGSSMSMALVGSDGKSHPVSHASLTVRPGGTTFDSVQLAPQSPGVATTRAGMMKTTTPKTAADDRPTESITFSYGKLVIEYKEQKADFQFSGGTLVNGNLRVSRASYTGGVHPQ
jgi:type VI protein secretion system component Hcp